VVSRDCITLGVQKEAGPSHNSVWDRQVFPACLPRPCGRLSPKPQLPTGTAHTCRIDSTRPGPDVLLNTRCTSRARGSTWEKAHSGA
jgi:hypothetical protein